MEYSDKENSLSARSAANSSFSSSFPSLRFNRASKKIKNSLKMKIPQRKLQRGSSSTSFSSLSFVMKTKLFP